MQTIAAVAAHIKRTGIIAILRGDFSVADMTRIGEALLAGGVDLLEVTLNSTQALVGLPALRAHFGERMLIGAGTVRNLAQLKQAMDAGAQFIVSPNFDPASVAHSQANGLLHLPGVFTPSEAQNAFAAGCRMLKLFPSDVVGPAYLKAIRAPLNDIEFVPTGGISLNNIADFAKAGAVAVGMGGQLVSSKNEASEALTTKAKALREAWDKAKT